MPKGKKQSSIPDKETKTHIISDTDRERIKLIANKARRLRTSMNISYEEFARNAGMNRNSYFRFEKSSKTGKNFTISTVIKVARGLGMSLSDFFQDL